jgi:hypothetical protein
MITDKGATIALCNADSPALKVAPLSTDPAVHQARVLRYFTEAGLPTDQIGDVGNSPLIEGGAPIDPKAGSPYRTFRGYATIISRQIQGFRVPESHAWARFNANDEVVAEEVFYPDLPASVVSEAVALRDMLNNVALNARFAAKVPADVAGRKHEVAIHHSPHFRNGPAFASVDFAPPFASSLGVRHFDRNGQEVWEAGDPPPATLGTKPAR